MSSCCGSSKKTKGVMLTVSKETQKEGEVFLININDLLQELSRLKDLFEDGHKKGYFGNSVTMFGAMMKGGPGRPRAVRVTIGEKTYTFLQLSKAIRKALPVIQLAGIFTTWANRVEALEAANTEEQSQEQK